MAQRSYVEQENKKNTKDTDNMWKVIRTCIPKKSTEKKCFSSDDESVVNNFTSSLHQLVQILSRKSNH